MSGKYCGVLRDTPLACKMAWLNRWPLPLPPGPMSWQGLTQLISLFLQLRPCCGVATQPIIARVQLDALINLCLCAADHGVRNVNVAACQNNKGAGRHHPLGRTGWLHVRGKQSDCQRPFLLSISMESSSCQFVFGIPCHNAPFWTSSLLDQKSLSGLTTCWRNRREPPAV